MKKRLAYFFIAIGIAILILYLFRYKRALIVEGKVPSSATEVVQINLRQIEHHLLVDVIKNPLKYIDFKTKKKSTIALKKTIIIPRNLLFFTNNSNLKDVWVSSFINIKDVSRLKNYFLQQGFKESTDEEFILFKKDKLVVCLANNRLIVLYRKQGNLSVIPTVQTVLNETNFLKKNTDVLKSISNSESDIIYASEEIDCLEANFKSGLFEIKGKIYSDLFKVGSYNGYSGNSVGFINTRINIGHTIFQSFLSDRNKKKFDNFTKLSLDSIISKWDGNMAFNLKDIDQKADTIITYEYDDDFNKLEKKSIQEIIIPDLTVELGIQSNLHEYLYDKNAIRVIENDTLFTSIPLYKFYAKTSSSSSFEISTEKRHITSPLQKKTSKLNAYFNFEKYLKNPLEFSFLPSNNEYIQLLKDVSIKYSARNDLSVKVKLKNDNRNFLGQLVKP